MQRIMDGKQPEGTMRTQIRKILNRLRTDCKDDNGVNVPVFWHGYDYPVPDGRLAIKDFPACQYSVLCQHLTARKYATLQDRFDLMQKIVDRYNALLAEFSQDVAYESFFVHADLRGTLNPTLAGDAYKADWANEMHATPAGFGKLAEVLVTKYL
jgi:hypothetical protein